jgi:hypothetical protein
VNKNKGCPLCTSEFDPALETARGFLAQRMALSLAADGKGKEALRRLRVTGATWRNWLNGRYAPDLRNFRALVELTGGEHTRHLCEGHRLAVARCGRSRVSERDAALIVARFAAGESADTIARDYPQCTARHVRQIVRGARYQMRSVFE